MSDAKKNFAIVIMLLLSVLVLNAQEKKENSLDSKLKEVKGKVQKIVITSDGKQTVFEGDEAQKLFQKFSESAGERKLVWINENGDSMKTSSTKKKFHIIEDNDGDASSVNKNVRVEKVDGDMIVTVETEKGGESEVKVYKGEEAEKFLQEEKAGGKFNVKVMKPRGKKHMIWLSADADSAMTGDKKDIEKKITVDKSGGETKVKVETTENGKTKVEEFTGDEAEKFLKENQAAGRMKILSSDGDDEDNVYFFRSGDGGDSCCSKCKKLRVKVEKSGSPGKVIILEKKDKKDEK